MDTSNLVIKLCIEGTRAEYAGKPEEAYRLYWQAWESAQSDYEACVAAHYVARSQETPDDSLRWNQEALRRADATGDESVMEFYPSLYLNLGRAYEVIGELEEARRFYALAEGLGYPHQP